MKDSQVKLDELNKVSIKQERMIESLRNENTKLKNELHSLHEKFLRKEIKDNRLNLIVEGLHEAPGESGKQIYDASMGTLRSVYCFNHADPIHVSQAR